MNNDRIIEDIKYQLNTMGDFAQLQLNVKKHRGEFGKLEAMRSTPQSFKNESDNVAAVAQILQMIKGIELAKDTGALSLTLMFKDGKAIHMQVQDFVKV